MACTQSLLTYEFLLQCCVRYRVFLFHTCTRVICKALAQACLLANAVLCTLSRFFVSHMHAGNPQGIGGLPAGKCGAVYVIAFFCFTHARG